MKTALIDHADKAFVVTITEGVRRLAIQWGSYREVIAHATQAGVPRDRVTLTKAAQDAALATCFGGTP